ncbi:MFS transporter [Paenibacillus sp. J5C_2022]|uniref:MFS transporter n=1 Tax=Paenibacillus sp. J5C2022 TaxID=2977129 RepID=UPI0021D090E3|nr:MFS transporter [Paenibacillus sp. J5C2022]MCU6707342.1 MFS transporter [Paenibacillus sp. J5C2022]
MATISKKQEKSVSSLPIRTRFYYGWLMVVISGIGIFFSGPGQTFSNSVFIESYMRDFSLNQTTVASIYSAATLISGLLLFFIGRLADKYGRRIMLACVALMLGLACFYNSFVIGPVTLFIGFFLIRYFGQGSMTLIPNTLVSQWFMKYRGRALSFAGLGGLIGAATFPPLINYLIEAYDWQTAWRILGATLILFFVPVAIYFVRNSPEDVGLLPDGAKESINVQLNAATISEDSWTLAEAIRTKAFWFVMICGAIPAMINTGITFQIFSILSEQGINRMSTAFVLSLVPIVSFGSSLLAGFIVERFRAHRVLSLSFVLSVLSPIILIFSEQYTIVILFAIVWGITQGLMNIPLGVIWPNYFGRKHLGSIQGVTHTALVIGSALGPIQFGWAYDQFGSYTSILLVCSAIWAVGAVLAWIAVPPSKRT